RYWWVPCRGAAWAVVSVVSLTVSPLGWVGRGCPGSPHRPVVPGGSGSRSAAGVAVAGRRVGRLALGAGRRDDDVLEVGEVGVSAGVAGAGGVGGLQAVQEAVGA